MSDLAAIRIDCECGVCGNDEAMLYTEARQAPESMEDATEEELDAAWWAHDGDEVKCSECGAVHEVSMDSEQAYVSLNEDHPDTLMAYAKREGAGRG